MNISKEQDDKNEEVDFSRAEAILDEYEGVHGALIPVLQKIQGAYGYLQESIVYYVADRMNMSASEIIGVATFYAQFHLKPRGAHIIKVCTGTACHVKGAPKIVEKFVEELDVPVGSTTSDKLFTLEEVACIGACSLAPVAMIDEDVHGKLGPDSVANVIQVSK
ncbi:MAG: NADH-quinone oxidoreductase subunit NuoE [Planctomycetes bacterium]|nr:NADH-quinone oxidoreductase subunit NuoE [Planctomycetota bacterium]